MKYEDGCVCKSEIFTSVMTLLSPGEANPASPLMNIGVGFLGAVKLVMLM